MRNIIFAYIREFSNSEIQASHKQYMYSKTCLKAATQKEDQNWLPRLIIT